MKEYKAGIYLRLSKEDKEKNNSIDMQRRLQLLMPTNIIIILFKNM